MRNPTAFTYYFSLNLLLMASLVSPRLAAQDAGFSAGLELAGLWDSNFSRSSSAEEERITRAALNLKLSNTFSKQKLSVALRFNQYDYQHNESLNDDFLTGRFEWKGQVASKLLLDLNANRDAYIVDPLEFTGPDTVTKDDVIARVGFGSRNKLSIFVGGRDTQQGHSASVRQFLNFDEQELFLQAQLHTAGNWTHLLSVHEGERLYENTLDTPPRDLDFDYRQYAYEVSWQTSDINQLTLGVAQFERDGELNSDTGTLLNAVWDWQVSPKVSLQLGYVLKQPALGEEVYSLIKEKNSSVIVAWQVTEQWRFETAASHSDQTYRVLDSIDERQETYMRWRPLAIIFERAERFDVRLDTELYERDSSEIFRDYDGVSTNLRFKLLF